MKHTFFLYIVAVLFVIGLAGCGDGTDKASASSGDTAEEKAPSIGQADLLHHRFVLKSVDGVDYSGKERVPDLAFNEGFRISGGICNRFMGQASLDGNLLFAKNMASTKMMCVDQDLNALEGFFPLMLEKGAAIRLEGKTLTLSGDGHVLVYELRDWVQ